MSQVMLERESAPAAESADRESFVRTAARVVLISVIVTALVAGAYVAFGGTNGSDPLAVQGAAAGQDAGGGGENGQAKAKPKPKPPTYEERSQKLAASLPSTTDPGKRRSALIKYLGKVGIVITEDSSPATAASYACDFLRDGTEPERMIRQVARGGGYSKAQSKAFLLGASTLYCPGHAKKFR